MQSSISIHALLAESDRLGLLGWLRTLISIHALLAESDDILGAVYSVLDMISIHALLAESDINGLRHRWASFYFYPRSPCGERLSALWMARSHPLFLSTLSLRRATSGRPETRQRGAISIHALLAESDPVFGKINTRGSEFLSTLSLRRATSKHS